ncbi:TetR/AcrR family transcriptional regulator [Methanocella arvoryzae]|uniref:Transcription regulator (TetR family) n=1 Tax=Methanocella arvoryzae (strain DSM 22066 / NBRC 105507 / MRE50) TaxID=351160 RepID=Q0W5Z9_METAR|nr:TetR/AcrR family transcriptional regulator [Methanocella arvoryzae]CAJ36194.1 transcription regulator (TetR family) [Methanocella arvoryzae MRE50]
MRVSKNPDVRRSELIEAAEILFREKGFKQTSVSDIVKKVGVAQGTFYYYFDSKDDALNAVIDHYIDNYKAGLERLLADEGLTPLRKVEIIVNDALGMHTCDRQFVEFLHSEENLVTHQKYMIKSFGETIPLMTKIVRQGIEAGAFDVDYPEETVEMMAYAFGYLEDALSRSPQDARYDTRLRAAERLIERALGIARGSLHITPSTDRSLFTTHG